MNELISADQAVAATIATFVIEMAKKSDLKWLAWIRHNTDQVNVAISVTIAMLISAGFKMNLTGDAVAGWHGSLYVPPIAAWAAFMGDSLKTWLVQEVGYRLLLKKGGGVDPAKLIDALKTVKRETTDVKPA